MISSITPRSSPRGFTTRPPSSASAASMRSEANSALPAAVRLVARVLLGLAFPLAARAFHLVRLGIRLLRPRLVLGLLVDAGLGVVALAHRTLLARDVGGVTTPGGAKFRRACPGRCWRSR